MAEKIKKKNLEKNQKNKWKNFHKRIFFFRILPSKGNKGAPKRMSKMQKTRKCQNKENLFFKMRQTARQKER